MKTATRIMMGIAGLFLLFASGLKVYQLLTEPLPAEPIIDTWLFAVIQVPLELGLGIWLVSGLFKKAGWLISQIGYGVFIGVTAWRLVTGQEDCGCFGTIHVDPKMTLFAIDIPIFLGLTIFYPRKEKLLPPPWPTALHFITVAIPTAIILSALVPTIVFNRPDVEVLTLPDGVVNPELNGTDVTPPGNGVDIKPVKNGTNVTPPDNNGMDTTQVEPQNGEEVKPLVKPVPLPNEWELLKKIDIADTIRKGMNITLLYREDCDVCHEAIPMFEEYAEMFGADVDSIRIALVELPPYGNPSHLIISEETKCLMGKYLSDKKVFGSTPIIVLTQDGVPMKSWDGKDPMPTFDDLMDAMSGGQ